MLNHAKDKPRQTSIGNLILLQNLFQALQGAVPDQELATIRGLALLLCVAPYFLYKREVPDVQKHSRRWVPALSITMSAFSLLMFVAVR